MTDKITFTANQLFKSICHRAPTKEEIGYFEDLERPSANPPLNSAVTHRMRTNLCKDNPNAKKFDNIYEQLHLANTRELEPFIALLDSVKKQPAIMEMLASEWDTENRQINTSNDRRNQEPKDSTIIATREVKNRKPELKCTLSRNKFQCLDFIDLADIPFCPKEFPVLKSLDKMTQEHALIKDLICCLMGCSGLYIRPLPLDSPNRQFYIDPTIYPPYLDIVKSILTVASYVSSIARYIDIHSAYEYGAVNQALAGAMDQQLKEFRLLVCQLQDLHLRGDLTLASMMNYIQDTGSMMGLMSRICLDIQLAKCRGGAILSFFSKLSPSIGSPKQKKLLKYLMNRASYPFFRTLKLWIFRGIIADEYKEFFIRIDPRYLIKKPSIDDTQSTLSSDFWKQGYIIESNLIPRFLEMHINKILNTGKYLNVIQLCGFDVEFPVIEDMVYETEDSYYVTQIDRAHDYASKLLLNIMFDKMKLKDHFKFMKHYFLLYEADWLNFFMDLANDELSEKVTDCQIGRLKSLLEVSIQSRSFVNDSLKDNLKVELSNQELIPFVFHVISFKPENKRINKEVVGTNLRVLEAFSLTATTEWPISLIFHKSVMQNYQMLFRHLFYCHHVARVLSSVWLMKKSDQQNAYTTNLINKASALGGRMHNFIRDLLYYMTTEVIEPFWNVFESKLDQAQNIDEVFQFHDDFLLSCVSNCMLSSKGALHSLQKMTVLCITYTNRFNRLMGGGDIDRTLTGHIVTDMIESKCFEDIIDQDDATFNSIMCDLIQNITETESDNKKLLNLAERMEYNYSYYRHNSDSDVDS